MKRIFLDEQAVIDCYKKFDSVKPVAAAFGVSMQTIYRLLIRNGIPRTNNKIKEKRLIQWSNKYCPALVGIAYYVDGITLRADIAKATGIDISSVNNILFRKFGVERKNRKQRVYECDVDIDAIERDYINGANTYELAEKYGVCHTTIGKWMKKRGYVCTKNTGGDKGRETQRKRAIEKIESKLVNTGGNISLVEFCGYKSVFKCNDCGYVFEITSHTARVSNYISCPSCEREKRSSLLTERKAQREAEKEAKRQAEYSKEKHCSFCGCVFHSENATSLYCSKRCKRKAKKQRDIEAGKTPKRRKRDTAHRARAREYGVPYDSSITKEKLIERDGITCAICGKPCDPNDTSWGSCGPLYPSIDCIIPMKKGGGFVWDNVQLAHVICNSNKRDLDMCEVVYAKEQGIADKCA